MIIRITKRTDGASQLVCRRSDGTESWQKHERRQSGFFPLHDITHFVVESVLGTREAFLGLVASGWELDDTTGKGSRGALPAEAIFVEHLVGLLDVERASSGTWSAEYLLEQIGVAGAPTDHPTAARLTEESLLEIRARRATYFSEWQGLLPGGTLELHFPGPAAT